MPALIRPQAKFLALPHKYRAYVAGYRAGKTWAGAAAKCKQSWEQPRMLLGYFAPTYPQIRDIFYPTIEEVAHDWGLRADIKQSNKEVHLFSGRSYRSTIICRSMENPSTIIGFAIGHALVDEIDTMPMQKAEDAWRKIIARLSQKGGVPGGIDVTTTPEGFHFTHKTWVKNIRDNPELQKLYGMIQASTYENAANLPPDYISSLMASYPDNLIDAYLNGQFVNLTQGAVYINYDRKLNASQERVQADEPVFVGMDFNIGKMAAVIHVKRHGVPHAVDEVVNAYDTPDMIRILREKYWKYLDGDWRRTRQIRIYPDSTGKNRTRLGAGMNDIALLEQAGFIVSAKRANPPVRDRVLAMNAMFCNAKGERRYFVNTDACPTYAECLEQQSYDERGEPDKKSDKDHHPDAGGYFISYDYPVERPVTKLDIRYAI